MSQVWNYINMQRQEAILPSDFFEYIWSFSTEKTDLKEKEAEALQDDLFSKQQAVDNRSFGNEHL